MTSNASRRRWWWLRPQFRDEPQNLSEHLPCDGDLGHLEDNIAAVAHHLGTDLDQLLLGGSATNHSSAPASPACARNCRGCRRAHEAGAAPRWRRTFGTTVAST